jgi:hypothetical protein
MEYYRNNFKTRLKDYLFQRYRSPHIHDLNSDQCYEVLTVLNFFLQRTHNELKRREIETYISEVSLRASDRN